MCVYVCGGRGGGYVCAIHLHEFIISLFIRQMMRDWSFITASTQLYSFQKVKIIQFV